MENFLQFLKKLNTELTCDPAFLLVEIYSKEIKAYVYTETCTRIFIAALFLIA